MEKLWTIFAFYSNSYIQKTVIVNENIKIYPFPGISIQNKADYLDDAVYRILRKEIRLVSSPEKVNEYQQNNNVVCVEIKMSIEAVEPNEAFLKLEAKLKIVTNFLSYYQKNAFDLFGILLLEDNNFYLKLVHSFPRKITYIDELPLLFNSAVHLSESRPRIKLYFGIYYDSLKEEDIDFKIFKLYSLLELMSQQYGEDIPFPKEFEPRQDENGRIYSSEKVKALFIDLEISIPMIETIPLIDIASKHRNCVSHFGACTPELNSKCSKWCKGIMPQKKTIVYELAELIWFTIRRFIITYGR